MQYTQDTGSGNKYSAHQHNITNGPYCITYFRRVFSFNLCAMWFILSIRAALAKFY